MGSEAVELIMAVGETFGIGLSDAEVSRVIKVGDLVDFWQGKPGIRLFIQDKKLCFV